MALYFKRLKIYYCPPDKQLLYFPPSFNFWYSAI